MDQGQCLVGTDDQEEAGEGKTAGVSDAMVDSSVSFALDRNNAADTAHES